MVVCICVGRYVILWFTEHLGGSCFFGFGTGGGFEGDVGKAGDEGARQGQGSVVGHLHHNDLMAHGCNCFCCTCVGVDVCCACLNPAIGCPLRRRSLTRPGLEEGG